MNRLGLRGGNNAGRGGAREPERHSERKRVLRILERNHASVHRMPNQLKPSPVKPNNSSEAHESSKCLIRTGHLFSAERVAGAGETMLLRCDGPVTSLDASRSAPE